MTRRDPFEEMERLFERMSREFERIGEDLEAGFGDLETGLGRGITVDVAEDESTVTVTADLPGYDRDDIDVTASDRTLTIAAERDESVESDAGGDDSLEYHRRERRRRSVSRRVRLPSDVDETAAEATYANGVLTIELPKTDADGDGHRIDVE
ncbi:Hsp20/alpha crystallin family protein [Halopenitus persicus]|uniref:HSP20 family protein n=1 Tax=Halopenitus persicus TaxID=1048396 RepID=A0A1H3FR62_9EURY|nr:Hsp20/alpha crystallin family protein [Halopenitus persicus]SDX92619.1 HSP20 family protein [Halopenitus persicus]